MVKKFSRGFKRKATIRKKPILIGCGIGLALVAFISLLGLIVVSDNASECKKIEMDGSLFGCSVNEKYAYDNITVVAGNTANSPTPSFSKLAKKYITNSIANDEDTDIQALSASSAKEAIVVNANNNTSEDNDGGISATVQDINNKIQDIENSINISPRKDGASYLEAITRALSAAISNRDDDNEKILILVTGSGLSDTGVLNFASDDDLLHRDTEEIIDRLVEKGKLQEGQFSGAKNVKIIWSGIGVTVAPQEPLGDSELNQVKDIYTQVFAHLFGTTKNLEFSDYISANTSSVETEHTVKTTKVQSGSTLWGSTGQKVYDTNSSISFNPSSTEFKNPGQANQELEVLASEIRQNPSYKITITGYAAYPISSDGGCDTSANLNDLTTRRADKVKAELIGKHVNADQVASISGGHGPKDECLNGSYDDNIAQENRIIIFKANKE